MGIIAWIVFGLLAGLLAKYLMPGIDPGGILITILLGIAGAVVGGLISTMLGIGDLSGFDVRSLAIAVCGSCLLLFTYRQMRLGGQV